MKKILVLFLTILCVFTLVSCKDKGTTAVPEATMMLSGDGLIHVNFAAPQATYTIQTISGNEYTLCKYVNINVTPLRPLQMFTNFFKGLALVSTDDTNQHFVLAISLNGSVLDTLGNVISTVVNVLPDKISITLDNLTFKYEDNGYTIETTTSGGSTTFKYSSTNQSFTVTASSDPITIDLDELSEMFAGPNFSPLYVSYDLLGLLSDYIAIQLGESQEGIIPYFTKIGVYNSTGAAACENTFKKVDLSDVSMTVLDTSTSFGNLEKGVTYYYYDNNGLKNFSFAAKDSKTFTCDSFEATGGLLFATRDGYFSSYRNISAN